MVKKHSTKQISIYLDPLDYELICNSSKLISLPVSSFLRMIAIEKSRKILAENKEVRQ